MAMWHQNIISFIMWQREHLKDIRELVIEDHKHHERLYKKTLYFPLIDSLSKVYSTEPGNRKRFLSTIDALSDWPNKNLVSVVHLKKFLDAYSGPEVAALRTQVDEAFSKLRDGRIHQIDEIDKDLSSYSPHWPVDASGKFSKLKISGMNRGLDLNDFSQKNLLYNYRNYCIHEFRAAGADLNVSKHNLPYYIHIMKKAGKEWNLVYPVEFFDSIAEKIISNLEKHLKEGHRDPYDSFNFSSYWIEEIQ